MNNPFNKSTIKAQNESIIQQAQTLAEYITKHRRHLHQFPEIGMEVSQTYQYLHNELTALGYQPQTIIENGIIAEIGSGSKTLLLRADMDALPIKESASIDYASTNDYMHACGHDFHMSMLLGVAKLLKHYQSELHCRVRLMFQPAEEIIVGAQKMVAAGVTNDVTMALMIHVLPNSGLSAGTVITPLYGETTLAADWFDIFIQGKGGHSATPHKTIDPLNIMTHIYTALQSFTNREVNPLIPSILSIGVMQAGSIGNVIPETAFMQGTLRTYGQENRRFLRRRITEISQSVANTYGGHCQVNINQGTPSIFSDPAVTEFIDQHCFGFETATMDSIFAGGKILFSEDFSYITEQVPGAILLLATDEPIDGICYPLHHPNVRFNEKALTVGTALFTSLALHYQ